jgi:hypothetical protein
MLEGSVIPDHVQFVPPIDPREGLPDVACDNLYDDLFSRSWQLARWGSWYYFPLWLGGSSPPDQATRALTAML